MQDRKQLLRKTLWILPALAEAVFQAAQAINIDNVWAEAYHLYKSGYRYWFTSEETTTWFGDNAAFQVQTMEDELLNQYFEPLLNSKPIFVRSSLPKL